MNFQVKNEINAYKAPQINLKVINIETFKENADNIELRMPPSKPIRITFCRPHVSAKKPQKCEEITKPANDDESRRPCSCNVYVKSHLEYGKK